MNHSPRLPGVLHSLLSPEIRFLTPSFHQMYLDKINYDSPVTKLNGHFSVFRKSIYQSSHLSSHQYHTDYCGFLICLEISVKLSNFFFSRLF